MCFIKSINIDSKIKKVYTGPDIDSKDTSINGKPSPGVIWLHQKRKINNEQTILDLGAGKFARNADYLRNLGYKVYAYDPLNGRNCNGWGTGNVSNKKPECKFDVVISSYVLNVVSLNKQNEILKDCKLFADKQFHIVRGIELIKNIYNSLINKRDPVFSFYKEHFKKEFNGSLEETTDLAIFGTKTKCGFQRLCFLSHSGLNLEKSTQNYAIYSL